MALTTYEILVPIDGNEERADAQAAYVASFPGAAESVRVTLLHVYPTVEGGDAGTERLRDRVGEPETLETVQRRLTERGIDVDTREEEGDVADAILAVSRELDPDTIVMAGRKRSPVGKAVFGSVTQTVILNADYPVTVVK